MPTILTVGYGREGFEPFEARLASHGVETLIDVRSAPYSKYQTDFRFGVIQELCLQSNLEYIYMGDRLGGRPSNPHLLTDGKPDYEKISASAEFRKGIEEACVLARERVVCLMCGCENPMLCHRGKLLAVECIAAGLDVSHILSDGSLIGHAEAVFNESGGQLSLF